MNSNRPDSNHVRVAGVQVELSISSELCLQMMDGIKKTVLAPEDGYFWGQNYYLSAQSILHGLATISSKYLLSPSVNATFHLRLPFGLRELYLNPTIKAPTMLVRAMVPITIRSMSTIYNFA